MKVITLSYDIGKGGIPLPDKLGVDKNQPVGSLNLEKNDNLVRSGVLI